MYFDSLNEKQVEKLENRLSKIADAKISMFRNQYGNLVVEKDDKFFCVANDFELKDHNLTENDDIDLASKLSIGYNTFLAKQFPEYMNKSKAYFADMFEALNEVLQNTILDNNFVATKNIQNNIDKQKYIWSNIKEYYDNIKENKNEMSMWFVK